MKKLLFVFAGLFLLQVGFAQSITKPVEKKSSLIISGGPAFPIGPFGTTTSEESGMAKMGYNLNLNYIYNLRKIGIVVHGIYANHGTKMPEGYSGYGITMGNWKYTGITAGVLTSYPAGGKGKIDLRVLAGAAFTNSPEFTYPGEGGTLNIPAVKATSFLGELGVGYRYMMNSNTFIYAGVDWIAMQPKFQDSSVYPEPMKQKISALNVNVGIGFNF